jgi:hypothetical protein
MHNQHDGLSNELKQNSHGILFRRYERLQRDAESRFSLSNSQESTKTKIINETIEGRAVMETEY